MPTDSKIVLLDLACHGMEHVPYNASMLQVVSAAFPLHSMVFAAEACHIQFVREAVASRLPADTQFVSLERSIERHERGKSRASKDLTAVVDVLAKVDSRCVEQFVLLASRYESLLPLKSYFSRHIPNARILHVMHGGAVKIKRRSRNPCKWFSDARGVIKRTCASPWVHIFLESSVREESLRIAPRLSQYSMVVQHPLPPDACPTTSTIGETINVGFLGGCSIAKGFDRFLEAAKIASSFNNNRFQFHAIGSSSDNLDDQRMRYLVSKPARTKIDRAEYVCRLAQLDYVFLPYSRSHYGYSPTGVLLDAIGFCKPIVCTEIPLFNAIFEQYGMVGIRAPEDDSWAVNIMSRISGINAEQYSQQCSNLAAAFHDRSLDALAIQYRAAAGNRE